MGWLGPTPEVARERQRFHEHMASAARALAADGDSRGEAMDIAEGALDDGLHRDVERHGNDPVALAKAGGARAPGEIWTANLVRPLPSQRIRIHVRPMTTASKRFSSTICRSFKRPIVCPTLATGRVRMRFT